MTLTVRGANLRAVTCATRHGARPHRDRHHAYRFRRGCRGSLCKVATGRLWLVRPVDRAPPEQSRIAIEALPAQVGASVAAVSRASQAVRRLDLFWWIETNTGREGPCLLDCCGVDGTRTRDPRRDRPYSNQLNYHSNGRATCWISPQAPSNLAKSVCRFAEPRPVEPASPRDSNPVITVKGCVLGSRLRGLCLFLNSACWWR